MSFQAKTQRQVRQAAGRLLFPTNDNFLVGTVSSAGINTLIADSLKLMPDDSFVGRIVYDVTTGERRMITDHVQSSGTITVTPSWTLTPSAADVFEIWPDAYSPDLVNDHIAMAIQRASDIVNVLVTTAASFNVADTNNTLVDLPATLVKLVGFEYLDLGGFPVQYRVGSTWYDTLDMPSAMLQGSILYLNRPVPSGVATMYVSGYRLPALPTADTDSLEIRPDYLTYQVAFMLDAGQASGPALDPEQHSGRAANWKREAEAIYAMMATDWLPGTIPIPGR